MFSLLKVIQKIDANLETNIVHVVDAISSNTNLKHAIRPQKTVIEAKLKNQDGDH